MTDRSENTLRNNTNINPTASLYPKRRMTKKVKRDGSDDADADASSPYFEEVGQATGKSEVESKSKSGSEQGKGTDKSEAKTSSESKPQRPRQTLLKLGSNGHLTMRQPLTNPISRSDTTRKPLKEVAAETKLLLPGLLATRPDVPDKGYIYKDGDAPILDQRFCPKLPSTRVAVVNSDSIDAALELSRTGTQPNNNRHPCVLNMANANTAGGGWMHGALAQEEALCYRTSLSRTLKKHYYPLPDKGGIYSPYLLVIRENMKSGNHDLLDLREPSKLPVISAVSVAAVCMPQTKTDANGVKTYALPQDRRLMEEKMRVILRIAAKNGHQQLVLGAFGCGAFANPKQEVAKMWATVLKEPEFGAGWWLDVLFAVLDDGRGNLAAFQCELDGLMV